MEIDYRKYAPGVAPAKDIALCPVCDESAHRRDTKVKARFVHIVRIERTQPKLKKTAARRTASGLWLTPKQPPARNKAVPIKQCEVKSSELGGFEQRAAERRKLAAGARP